MLNIIGGVRNNLSPYTLNEQFTFDGHSQQHLDAKYQMALGAVSNDMERITWNAVNKPLVNRERWVEFLDVLGQLRVDFSSAADIRSFFSSMGVDTRTGNTFEMYLSMDELKCDYCVQVDLDRSEPFFVKLKAYAKNVVQAAVPTTKKKYRWWEGL